MNGIAVIIPVYNGARMLEGCLGSVTGARVTEIIIVDDGSTDDTLAVARALAVADPRVRVIHTDNHGIYEARRTGIAASTAPYIAFLDADDRYCADALDMLSTLLEAHDADVAMGGIVETHSVDAPEPGKVGARVRTQTPEEMWPRLMRWGTREFILYAWHKLYKRALLEGLVPCDGICQGEDVLITCQVFLKARKTVETTAPVYLYLQNPESILHARFGPRDLELTRVWDCVVDLMPEGQLKTMARVNRWRTDYTLMTRLILANDRDLDARYAGALSEWRSSLALHWRAVIKILPTDRKALLLGLRFAFGPSRAALRLGQSILGAKRRRQEG